MVHIKKSNDGQFFFVIIAKNGNTLVTSETYRLKASAIKGARAVQLASLGEFKDKTVK